MTSVWSCVRGSVVSSVWRVSVYVAEGEVICEEETCLSVRVISSWSLAFSSSRVMVLWVITLSRC